MTRVERDQALFAAFRRAGNKMPTTSRAVAEWGLRNGYLTPREEDVISQFAAQIGDSLRQECFIDSKGRKVRANYAAPSPQGMLWNDATAPRKHIEAALKHRRRLIVGDCFQLKMDLDSYNENHTNEPQIAIPFDFTNDLTELERERQIEARQGLARKRKQSTRASRRYLQGGASSNAH